MEGEHAQMWQIPCKMTNSSSKPLQTLGKWYQPRNPKKIPKPAQKKILKLFHTLLEIFLREYTEELFNGYEKYFNVEEIKEYLQKVVNT